MDLQDLNPKIIHQSASLGSKDAIYRPDHQKYLSIAGRRPQTSIKVLDTYQNIKTKMAATTLIENLKSASLLPSKIIPANFTPTYDLTVSFPAKTPSNGSLVRVSEVKEKPSVNFSLSSNSGSAQSFTFLLIDPDAPTPDDPKFAYWRHWVVVNIPSSASGDGSGDVKDGETLTQYLAPGPKDESGPHRYLFLLFKEPQGFSISKDDVGGEEFVDRRSFGAKEFVEKHGLELVGVEWMRGVGDGWNGGKDEL
jgi:phosphatidylethanolamine-binding protein (PEBP) family uncharacterized protein